jgi:hypothetical protein
MPSVFLGSAMMSRKRSAAFKRRQQRKDEYKTSSAGHQEMQEEVFAAQKPGTAEKRRSYRTMSTSSRTTATGSAPILIQREDEENDVRYGYDIVVPSYEPVEEMPETRQFFGVSCMRQFPPSAVVLESFDSERSLPFFGEECVFIQSPGRFQQSRGYVDYPETRTESHQGISALVPGTIQRGISTTVDLDERTLRSNLFHSLERQESR